jgi:hypothetical protein
MEKMRIRKCCVVLIVVLQTCVWLFAGSTKYASIFRSPRAGLTDLSGKKIAAFVVIPAEEMREAREETLATELRARGIDCIAGHLILPVNWFGTVKRPRRISKRPESAVSSC